jgi:hypothetical protein
MAESSKTSVSTELSARGGEIPAEWFLDDHFARGAPNAPETRDDRREQSGRNGEIIERSRDVLQGPVEPFVGCLVPVVALHVTKRRTEPGECLFVNAAMFLQTVVDTIAERLMPEVTGGDPDYRHLKMPVPDHALKRRIDFLSGKITGGAE